MRTYLVLFTLALTCLLSEGRSLTKRELQNSPALDSAQQNFAIDDEDRDKREVDHHYKGDSKFAIKNALLGFVFHPSSGQLPRRTTKRTTPKPSSTTTEDIVIFEKNKAVSLDIPGQLFGSSFGLVTELSNTVGDYMINSAIRLQRVLELFRPLIRGAFGAKGFVIEGPTNKPLFSDVTTTAAPAS